MIPDILIARKSTRALYNYLDSHVRWIRKLQTSSGYEEKPKSEWSMMETFASERVSDKVGGIFLSSG